MSEDTQYLYELGYKDACKDDDKSRQIMLRAFEDEKLNQSKPNPDSLTIDNQDVSSTPSLDKELEHEDGTKETVESFVKRQLRAAYQLGFTTADNHFEYKEESADALDKNIYWLLASREQAARRGFAEKVHTYLSPDEVWFSEDDIDEAMNAAMAELAKEEQS